MYKDLYGTDGYKFILDAVAAYGGFESYEAMYPRKEQ